MQQHHYLIIHLSVTLLLNVHVCMGIDMLHAIKVKLEMYCNCDLQLLNMQIYYLTSLQVEIMSMYYLTLS